LFGCCTHQRVYGRQRSGPGIPSAPDPVVSIWCILSDVGPSTPMPPPFAMYAFVLTISLHHCSRFRLHGDRSPELIDECGRTGSPNEVWHYGEEAYGSIVRVMKLRESIRPYVSAIMAEANETGVPAVRPLFLEFPNDAERIAAQGDQIDAAFMFGPDYLISPVTKYNAASWKVYLPKLDNASAQWVHHYTNKTFIPGQVYNIDVSDLDTFPFFKRTDPKYATV